METPSSTRRVTRSQSLAAMNSGGANIPLSSKKPEDSISCQLESRQRTNNGKQHHQERSALIDITNDSPIVGLATQTPSSAFTAKRKNSRIKRTPGSGEALLRGQVKTLLQKVEEEAELTKISTETRPFIHLVSSPVGLLAPTPANTPQIPNFVGDGCLGADGVEIVIASPVVEEHLRTSQEVDAMFEGKEESLESLKSLSITRSLLLDFSDKSESWDSSDCSSVVTQNGENEFTETLPLSPEEDDSSVWSMQVNASTRDEEDEEDVTSYKGEEGEEYNDEEEEEDGDVDGLCEGMMKMSVKCEKTMAEFTGKHTRFVYDSDGEKIVEARGVLRLKGLPTPKGKYFRFAAEEDEDTVSQ